jgi:hypothetical protein
MPGAASDEAMKLYILVDRKPMRCHSLKQWAEWHADSDDRQVGLAVIGQAQVSTVFLGIDQAFRGRPPMLFETMVFGGPVDKEQLRCSTWEQAETQHESVCARLRGYPAKVKVES